MWHPHSEPQVSLYILPSPEQAMHYLFSYAVMLNVCILEWIAARKLMTQNVIRPRFQSMINALINNLTVYLWPNGDRFFCRRINFVYESGLSFWMNDLCERWKTGMRALVRGGGVSGWERFSLASVYRSYFTHRTHFALINYWPVNKQDVKWYKLGIHHALGKGLEGTGRGNGSKRTQWESEKGDATITLLPRMKKGGEKSPDWEIQGEKESG